MVFSRTFTRTILQRLVTVLLLKTNCSYLPDIMYYNLKEVNNIYLSLTLFLFYFQADVSVKLSIVTVNNIFIDAILKIAIKLSHLSLLHNQAFVTETSFHNSKNGYLI